MHCCPHLKYLVTNAACHLQVTVPKGRILALCPFVAHHDNTLYPPKADVFDPNRKPLSLGDGTAVVPSVPGVCVLGGGHLL